MDFPLPTYTSNFYCLHGKAGGFPIGLIILIMHFLSAIADTQQKYGL
jgi:hypothetical protein